MKIEIGVRETPFNPFADITMAWLYTMLFVTLGILMMVINPTTADITVMDKGDTYIIWDTTSIEPINGTADGIPVIVYPPVYTMQELTPGSIHYLTVGGVTYSTRTTDSAEIWLIWGALFIAYMLIFLVLRIPIALLLAIAYDLWLAFSFMPLHTAVAPQYSITASVLALVIAILAASRSV